MSRALAKVEAPAGPAPAWRPGFQFGLAWTTRAWPAAVVIGMLALLAVFLNGGGRYIVDNHDVLQRSPGSFLARQAYLWDSSGGLGRAQEQSWVVPSIVFALLRGVGLSSAIAGRVFHALLLATAGAGMVVLVRQFRPRIGTAHLVAGLLYAFNPWTAMAIVPSVLFFPYALSPWFLVVFLRGVRERQPWRWAAAFALLTFAAGTADLPGLTYGLVPLVPCALYVVHVERSAGWGRVIAWFARAAFLTVGVFIAGLVRMTHGESALANRLGTTEHPRFLNTNSSWAETWRGLGQWGAYLRDADGLLQPRTAQYFASAATILATFVAPCAALFALWRSRWRPRLVFGSIALVSTALMVGAFPPSRPTPYGHLLLNGYESSLFLWGWRNSYKAGPGWGLGVAALAGLTVAMLLGRVAGHARVLVVAGAVGLFGLASFPFWTGDLYGKDSQAVASPPSYWAEANRWLHGRSTAGRVLVLPGANRITYRWGPYGGSVIDAGRPHLVASFFPASSPQTADLLAALEDTVDTGTLSGSVAPIARRLGVRYILIQNDLDWKALDRPRPALFDVLRKDPALQRVATFGLPGQWVVDPDEQSVSALYESLLPPVEIYELVDRAPSVQLRQGGALVVSGDGAAWPGLARDGVLDAVGPVLYSGSSRPRDITAALRRGGRVIVTDTDRRRLTVATATAHVSSYTLAAGADLERPANPLFTETSAQSVATYGVASEIRASNYGPVLGGGGGWMRPANAFDDDLRTAWRVGGLGTGAGEWIEVQLNAPHRVSRMKLVDSPLPIDGRHISRATIEFSDGSHVRAALATGVAEVRFSPRRITSFRIRIDELAGAGQDTVGFAEISVPGLDLRERVRVPDDLAVNAAASPALRQALARASAEFRFERSRTIELHDEELVLRRRFLSIGTRDYTLSGTLRTWADTPDSVVADLVGGSRPTFGSSRVGGMEGWGGSAVDGDHATTWDGNPNAGETLTSRFARAPVTSAQILVASDAAHSLITELRIRVGEQTVVLPVPPPADCPPSGPCVATVDVPVDGSAGLSLVAEVTGVQIRNGPTGPSPIGIAEIVVNGESSEPVDRARPLTDCFSDLVQIDGRDVPVQMTGVVDDVLGMQPMAFTACPPSVSLRAGVHDLDGASTVLVDTVSLRSGHPEPVEPRAASERVDRVAPGSLRLRLDGRRGDVVLSGQSYDPDWRAVADGHDLGRPLAVDTQSGWRLPRDASTVMMQYAPQRSYRSMLAVSLAFIAACGWLVFRSRSPGRKAASS